MWRADPTHSSTAQAGPSSLSLAWEFTTNGSIISSPSVAYGMVYFGSEDKNIYAVGAYSGSLIWNFTANAPIVSSPAVANGMVYTGGDDGYVYCLNAYTGARIWQTFVNGDLPFAYGDIVLKSSPAVSGGIVYVGSLDGYLYALNANTGAIVWEFQTQGPIECSPALADGAVYFTSQQPSAGMLYALDADTGNLIWNLTLPYQHSFIGGTEMLGSPSVAAGIVFASSDWGAYYAVNETTGKVIWDFIDPEAIEFIISSPIYVNGQLYIIDKFDITSLNATTGKEIWSFYVGDEFYVSPSYADGKIYMVTSERHIYILNANAEGAKLAVATTPSSSWSSPTIANGDLYVGCNNWDLYCYTNNPSGITSLASPTPAPAHNIVSTTLLDVALVAIVAAVTIAALAISYGIRKRPKKSKASNSKASVAE